MVATATQLQDEQHHIAHLQDVFAKQKAAYAKAPYPTAKERRANLDKLAEQVSKFKDKLAEALNTDFSCRSTAETYLYEVFVVLEGIKYNKKNLKKWMKPSKRHTSLLFTPASNTVQYQPKGVVGIITPWNYPIMLSMGPLTAALAAGNRAVIKLSEFTPNANIVIQQMLAGAFDEDEVAVVLGEAEVGAQFSNLKWDHLIFTGSTAVGKHVMNAAGKNLVPVTLELGGKSPCIITDNAAFKGAVKDIVYGKTANAGQTCIAPDYLMCPTHMLEELKQEIATVYKQYYPTIKDNNDCTAIINERQFNRLQGLVSDAKEKGATVQELNNANEDFSGTRKIPLTLVSNTTEDMTIMQDEIFGPLLPIITYESLPEAIEYINARPRPLALYLLSHSRSERDLVIKGTHAGGMSINDTLTHVGQDDIPFGGVGDSGIGHYHGKEGFFSLSHAKSVYRKGYYNSTRFLHAPHNSIMHKLVFKFLIK